MTSNPEVVKPPPPLCIKLGIVCRKHLKPNLLISQTATRLSTYAILADPFVRFYVYYTGRVSTTKYFKLRRPRAHKTLVKILLRLHMGPHDLVGDFGKGKHLGTPRDHRDVDPYSKSARTIDYHSESPEPRCKSPDPTPVVCDVFRPPVLCHKNGKSVGNQMGYEKLGDPDVSTFCRDMSLSTMSITR